MELYNIKNEYNSLADELDEVYTKLLMMYHNKIEMINDEIKHLETLYNTKRQQREILYNRMIELETIHDKQYENNEKDIQFINTQFKQNGLIKDVPKQRQKQIITNSGYNDEDNMNLTRDDFATDWEYNIYMSLK